MQSFQRSNTQNRFLPYGLHRDHPFSVGLKEMVKNNLALEPAVSQSSSEMMFLRRSPRRTAFLTIKIPHL